MSRILGATRSSPHHSAHFALVWLSGSPGCEAASPGRRQTGGRAGKARGCGAGRR